MLADAKRVQAVFLAAVEIADAALRAAYLDRECNSDPDLRQRVEALLQAHEAPASILAEPVVAPFEEAPCHTLPLEVSADQALPFTGNQSQESATMGTGSNEDEGPSPLEILQPSTKPGSLGRLGHYEVLEVLGQGGFGTVVKAYDEKLHRMIAIKIMSPRLAATSPARKRFMREARSSAAIRHENVVDIHAIEEQPIPFLVMEYVAGETLQQRLDRVGPLDPLEVLRIGVQIAHGLAAAHAMGKIHRDIKPANILLENGVDRVKITDFGLARAADDASLTQSGLIAGTPMYMAPEQAQGVALDQRADLFSFGSVLYVMCSGRPPFRASTTLAVLKRVADDTPRSIHEIIPEVPEWLCNIITKLHAKNPNERYQTAQEVADLLAKYLTELQLHGKVNQESEGRGQESEGRKSLTDVATPAPMSDAGPTKSTLLLPTEPRRRGRRLAVAAALLLCLVGGFAFTEATGVTKLRSTVIRILTPDGTLVVEVDDPGVKVTVEGDGGLVITGAGLEEIRLRPGSYKVYADRDGKKVLLDRELVSISKGGREVVRVKLVQAPPAPVVAKTEKGAFVLLAAGKERKFDTLAEAVQFASDGDTIEVRGNGPFVSEGVTVSRPLVIRAGEGFAPLLRLSEPAASRNTRLITTSASLVLEGLDLRVKGQVAGPVDGRWPILLSAFGGAKLHVANCLLGSDHLPITSGTSVCNLRNCQVLSSSRAGVDWYPPPGGRCSIANSVIAVGGLSLSLRNPDLSDVAITLRDSTIVGYGLSVNVGQNPDLFADPNSLPLIRWDFSANVTHCSPVYDRFATVYFEESKENPLAPEEAEAFIRRLINLREQHNVYPRNVRMLQLKVDKKRREGARGHDLADWEKFWAQKETGSLEGEIRFQGGDLMSRARTVPELITAEDFRLRPDSAGYKAGKDGKDLGANVDLVGPGPAYERWKKTAGYQQWLKDSGQLRAETAKPEPGAFVRLGGKGVAERKFDTLAEAVESASDGDTIEVRGNGPFVSQPIKVTRALCIRAGAGCRPVIQLSPEAIAEGADLLETLAPLIVEGLELQRVPQAPNEHKGKAIILARAPLYVANCRFLATRPWGLPVINYGPICELRNCEIIGGGGLGGVSWYYSPHARLNLDNCCGCFSTPVTLHYLLQGRGVDYTQACAIRMTRNTFVAQQQIFMIGVYPGQVPNLWTKDLPTKPTRCETEGNILDARLAVALFSQTPPGRILSPEESEASLPQVFSWHGTRNLYAVGGPFLRFQIVPDKNPAPVNPIKSVAEWGKYWGTAETGSIEGRVRYQGGDLLSRLAVAPEKLTAEDFRLRADSAGYKVGKDGKDLGADVDLVGPGPGYERWKKTTEYQQWLKDTKQVK
jgi:serine/threonine protein kinase/endonuclease YncB( thermonuclease family)